MLPRPSLQALALDSGLAPDAAMVSVTGAGKLKFTADSGFQGDLKRRVAEYFRRTGLSPRDSPRMYVKSAAILLWFVGSYALLVFVAAAWWQWLPLAISLAFAVAGVGFSIQHDANHGAYSRRGTVNRLMGWTLDLVGASSYVWHWKHNVFHHTYPNLSGADEDIDLGPLGRLSPSQPRYGVHRLQQFYLWVLYGFLLPKWHMVDDFKSMVRARIAKNPFPRPSVRTLFAILAGKAVFFGWALLLPMLFHPWWVVLLFYSGIAFLIGITLSVVFQLAHCVEESSFPEVPSKSRQLTSSWAIHQVQTTVDFARQNRLLTWYLGGLNFQVEHHLFPRICHIHYPRISPIVETVCAEFGVRYIAHKSLLGAISSHWRWLRLMGRPLSTELRVRGDRSEVHVQGASPREAQSRSELVPKARAFENRTQSPSGSDSTHATQSKSIP